MEDRFLLIDSDMYDQLMDELNITQYREAAKDLDLPKGVIGKLYGFFLMERTTVLTANNASTPVIEQPEPQQLSMTTVLPLYGKRTPLSGHWG